MALWIMIRTAFTSGVWSAALGAHARTVIAGGAVGPNEMSFDRLSGVRRGQIGMSMVEINLSRR
jgi:hypothetical protein